MSAKVSVIIPTYDMASTLGRAINSVLSQTYSNLEILVVDDGSTDGTQLVVTRFKSKNPNKIQYMRRDKNEGRSSALNLGISNSTGEFIAFLDADDTLPRDSLEDRVDYLQARPSLDAVFTNTKIQSTNGITHSLRTPQTYSNQQELAFAFLAASKKPFHPLSLMYRRYAFEKAGLFDTRYKTAEDVDFVYRLLTKCKVGYLPRVTYYYTIDWRKIGGRLKRRFSISLNSTRIIYANTHGLQRLYLIFTHTVQQMTRFVKDEVVHYHR